MIKKSYVSNESGQAMLETAIVLPLVLMIILFMVSTGMFIYSKIIVVQAASFAARSGSDILTRNELSEDEMIEKIKDNAKSIVDNALSPDNETIEVEIEDQILTVEVIYDFPLVLPFVSDLFKDEDFLKIRHKSQYIYGDFADYEG